MQVCLSNVLLLRLRFKNASLPKVSFLALSVLNVIC